MTNVFIGKNGSSHIAHHLVHFDPYPSGILLLKSHWLHMGVDLAPLLGPIFTDLFRPCDKTAFKRSRPSHVRCHQGEGGVNVPRIERRVGRAE